MNDWGEFVSMTAETFKMGDSFAGYSVYTDAPAYAYVWTANGDAIEDCLDDGERLTCDAVAFNFACSVHGYGDSLIDGEIENIGAQDVFENWADELRAIAASLLTDPLRQPVCFMTLWHCSAGKSSTFDGDDYWTEWELVGVVEPSATGVTLKPISDFAPQEQPS